MMRQMRSTWKIYRSQATGWTDGLDGDVLRGWAADMSKSETPLHVEAFVGSRSIGSGLADQFRQDLVDAGYGHGRHGFAFRVTIPPLTSIEDFKVVAHAPVASSPTRRRAVPLQLSRDAKLQIMSSGVVHPAASDTKRLNELLEDVVSGNFARGQTKGGKATEDLLSVSLSQSHFSAAILSFEHNRRVFKDRK